MDGTAHQWQTQLDAVIDVNVGFEPVILDFINLYITTTFSLLRNFGQQIYNASQNISLTFQTIQCYSNIK